MVGLAVDDVAYAARPPHSPHALSRWHLGAAGRAVGACLAAFVATAFLPAVCRAQGFYVQSQSAKGSGRAFSGEVADTGASSLWWNPAAIATSDGPEIVVSAALVVPKAVVSDRGTSIRRPGGSFAPVGGDLRQRDPVPVAFIPSGSLAVPLGDRLAFGLAVTAPYNILTEYDATSWTRYNALRTRLTTIDVQPSLAASVTDWLRVGGGVNVEHSSAELTNALPNLAAALGDGRQALSGRGWDLGWSAGVQLHNEVVTVGISYKSAIRHTLKGSATVSGLLGPLASQNGSVEAEASFYTPAQVVVGGRVRVSTPLTLDLQYTRLGWSRFDAIRLGAPLNTALPQGYRDSDIVAGGVDFQASPGIVVRAGVQHAATPTRDGNRDARAPDGDRWSYGAGASIDVGSRFAIDVAATYVSVASNPIDRMTGAFVGSPAATPVLLNGEVDHARGAVVSLGGRMRL